MSISRVDQFLSVRSANLNFSLSSLFGSRDEAESRDAETRPEAKIMCGQVFGSASLKHELVLIDVPNVRYEQSTARLEDTHGVSRT